MKQLSIKDIARIAGVVPSTVSFVINGKEKEMRISEEMAKKIRKIIKETGYVPNRSAASLRTGKTHVIGLIVEDISNRFFASLAKAIEDIAYQVGYRLVYCSTENDDKKGTELIRMLHKQVDGFIVTPTSGMKEEVLKLKKAKKPIVLLDRYFTDVDIPSVLVDNKEGIQSGVQLLAGKGYKKIAFIVTALEQMQMQDRLNAFKTSAKAHGLLFPELILELPFAAEEDAYEEGIKAFLKGHQEVDAIFFATNYLAIQGLKVLQELKWKIPSRVAVLSFDDHEIFKLYTPAITSISQPIAAIAREGIENLRLQMNAQKVPAVQELLLPSELIVRKSV
ncbi:LacI family DNA-binding transcriptional regulator [Niabella yanshanensis]|uniref:LacI family DNA-binding transcriptional regulator n=1 Tax=Niabella yanshanensis TaxID=577386 RepID=A0ABZ0W741_9BACT|nr:LacI family DNA-binding transcriptional regulator [Niabella yanshanensis]WQD37886.1 LacI family DNA-binding transcriptional regulator [Niabella yanshanensis]